MKWILVFCSFIVSNEMLKAQQFGGNPPSTRWHQVNTPLVRVIFPGKLDSQATRVANIATYLDAHTLYSIGNRKKKINIVLQNSTTISNAYVALGPYRSEFQMTPQQNSFELGSLPWPDNLAIHEMRHVQQYNNFNRGLSKAFYFFFGEEGQALANGLSVPDWFFEGDAVYQETFVSNQGRGRLPYFFNGFRALWQHDINYSWMKLRNGSLKDYVPDHYRLGYMLVAYGREKYGDELWKYVTNDAAAFDGLFYPFQHSIKKHAFISFKKFRTQAIEYFKKQNVISPDSIALLNNVKGSYRDEEYPQWIDTSTLVYVRSSFDRIPQFVIRNPSGERVIRASDISIDHYFSYKNGKIIYSAYQPDLRWGWRDYSDLKILDIQTGKQIALTKNTKYFAPDISQNGKTIVAVDVDDNGNATLHLLGDDGKLIKKIPNPDHVFYTYPKFYSEEKIVSAIRDTMGRMSLALIDVHTGNNTSLTPASYNVIGFPSVEDSVIYFTSSSGRHDWLYKWEGGNVALVQDQLENETFTGNYQPAVMQGKKAWTTFTYKGFRIMQSDSRQSSMRMDDPFRKNSNFGITEIDTAGRPILDKVPSQTWPIKKYSKSFHLINIHSLRPYINDPDYSLSIVSQNVLNTLEAELYASYNRNEGYKEIGANALYGAWFPRIKLGGSYTIDRSARLLNNSHEILWDEWETRAGVSIPLNLTSGRTYTRLTAGSDFVYNKRSFKGYYKDSIENRGFGYLSNSLIFTNQIQQAKKQINPRFAQSLVLVYKTAVTKFQANQFLASGNLYLPGAFQTHSLVLQAAFHIRDTLRDVIFSNSFPFSRGYTTANFHRMWKVGANYHLPLVYPDWGFGDLLYFLRIRANLFYDYTKIQDYNRSLKLVSLPFRSLGTEVFFDTKWWNQLPVTIGIRYSRLLDADLGGRGVNQWEIVLPTDLLSR